MKLVGLLLLLLSIGLATYFSIGRYYPDYFLLWNNQELFIEDFGFSNQDLSKPSGWLPHVYQYLLQKYCDESCTSMIAIPKDIMFAEEVFKSQIEFLFIKNQNIILNYDFDDYSFFDLPWKGAEVGKWNALVITKKENLSLTLMTLKRLIRDYPGLRIYLFVSNFHESKDDNYCYHTDEKFWQKIDKGSEFLENKDCSPVDIISIYPLSLNGPSLYLPLQNIEVSIESYENLAPYVHYEFLANKSRYTFLK